MKNQCNKSKLPLDRERLDIIASVLINFSKLTCTRGKPSPGHSKLLSLYRTQRTFEAALRPLMSKRRGTLGSV